MGNAEHGPGVAPWSGRLRRGQESHFVCFPRLPHCKMPVEGGADFDFHRDLGHISKTHRGGNAADLACSWLRTPAKDAL